MQGFWIASQFFTIFLKPHCALDPTPHMPSTSKRLACPRAAQKSATYRSPPFLQALLPSAGTITFKIELRSGACA
jgi:hypothetical protein